MGGMGGVVREGTSNARRQRWGWLVADCGGLVGWGAAVGRIWDRWGRAGGGAGVLFCRLGGLGRGGGFWREEVQCGGGVIVLRLWVGGG